MKSLEPPQRGRLEAGCDEAGRGCLAGPVVCAAVVLPEGFDCPGLDDSKKLTARRREKLRDIIKECALAWAVVEVGNEEIDRINILNASIAGMHRAVDALKVRPEIILVDGNRFTEHPGIPHKTVVGGDGLHMSIAAASILAKTHRDSLMERLAEDYPWYGWEKNKGYPTRAHLEGMRDHGLTPYHRRSFGPCAPGLFDTER